MHSPGHHAVLYIGNRKQIEVELRGEHADDAPDLRLISLDRLTIDETRTLTREASLMPVVESFRDFIISCNAATNEAQNALLKLLEDPPAMSRFHVIVPHEDVLLPTVLSRLHYGEHVAGNTNSSEAATAFLQAPYAKRLEMVVHAAKEKDEEWFRSCLRGLEQAAEASEDSGHIRDVILVQRYMGHHGASKKMLFEHLALSFPAD